MRDAQCRQNDDGTDKPEKLHQCSIAALDCYKTLRTTKSMATQCTLPYDPFLLLDKSNAISKVAGSGINIYKSAGSETIERLTDDESGETFEVTSTSEVLLFDDNGVPRSFAVQARYDGSFDDEESSYQDLTDGITVIREGHPGDYDPKSYVQMLAMSDRSEISEQPIALLDEVMGTSEGFDADLSVDSLKYEPYVVIFSKKSDKYGLGYLEEDRIAIADENNEYWEGVFEYDINQDGVMAEYRTFELYARPTKDEVNGKVIEGKKTDEVLKGGKKDDHIDGKKGNDIVKGKIGNDALFGSKGRDQLYGSKGDDYLSGGSGDDILEGGKGADIFQLSSGGDQIIDFNIEDGDKIAMDGKYVGDFTVTSTDSGSIVSVEGYGSLEVDISLEGIDLVAYVVQSV